MWSTYVSAHQSVSQPANPTTSTPGRRMRRGDERKTVVTAGHRHRIKANRMAGNTGRRPWPWIWIWRSNRPLKPVSHYLIVSLSAGLNVLIFRPSVSKPHDLWLRPVRGHFATGNLYAQNVWKAIAPLGRNIHRIFTILLISVYVYM